MVVAWNQHRHHGGGGGKHARDACEFARNLGHEVEIFTRSSQSLAPGLRGRLRAASSIVAAPESVREFEALLDRFRPHLVHALELFPLVSPYILPAARARAIPVLLSTIDYRLTCPVVTHLRNGAICTQCCGGHEYWAVLHNCRGSIYESTAVAAYSALTRVRKVFTRNVTLWEAPSDFVRSFLMSKLNIPGDRIRLRPPAIDIPADPVPDPSQGSYAGYAGRFTREKGVRIALEAARLTGLPFRFARNQEAQVRIQVPGGMEEITRDASDLWRFYRGARFLVAPSLWWETFCIVVAEAMSHGIPVIVPRHGAIGELVDHGVNGLHFAPGDVAELAKAVTTLWADAGLCRRLGAAAREKAIRCWGLEKAKTALLDSYETAVALGAALS
ncbi:MAG: glycosyltransferase family 4 protein [Bryobacterales bacterium]|nr:glycosyltransferase family 4 protein [Bryobacterales bacterium]